MKAFKLFGLLGIFVFSLVAQTSQAAIGGRVLDSRQKPVPGVVVNDGVNFTVTDKNGAYTLPADGKLCRYVSISVPAAYRIPVNEYNLIRFYQPIDAKNTSKSYDFVLEKRDKVSRKFNCLVFSDPQPKNDFHFVRFFTEAVPDVKNFLKTIEGETYGFVEGDIVSDALHLYPLYVSAVSSWGIPMMHVIGNHDFDLEYAEASEVDDWAEGYAEKKYESYYGPTDYSLNIGGVHIICMKDINYHGRKKYDVRLLKEQLDWLKKDLSYIEPGTTVFLNVHAPLYQVINDQPSREVLNILKDYNVHVFSGHTHYHKNEILAENIYEHNVGAVCGFHWIGKTSRCGTPNGYMWVEVDGNDVRWHFKSTGYDIDHQFKIYKPGKFDTQREYVVANVWDWDPACQVKWYEDGVLQGIMEQFADIDQEYARSGRVNIFRTDHLFRAKPSKTAKSIKIEVVNRFGETYTQTVKL